MVKEIKAIGRKAMVGRGQDALRVSCGTKSVEVEGEKYPSRGNLKL